MFKSGSAAWAALVLVFLLIGGAPVFADGQIAPAYRSNGQPSGNVSGSSQTISLNTNEAAACRLSSAPGQTYDSMLPFITTGGTYHANLIQGLLAGVNNFYVKCKNAAGSVNYDDYLITFTVTPSQTPASQPYVSATATTPSSAYIGQTVYTTASFSNSGSAAYVNFYPYLCRSDGTNCVSMTCPQYSGSSIYVGAYGSASASCYATANAYGSNMIRMSYNFPGSDQTAYSGIFFVGTSYPQSDICTVGYTGNYQCSGNTRQGQYRYSDCSTAWSNIETCSFSCSDGRCVSQSGCTAGYTGNYQCSGNVKQTQYRYSDCSTGWTNSETCSYGCSGGQCAPQPVQPIIVQIPQPVQYVVQPSPSVQYVYVQPSSPSVQYIVQPAQEVRFITQSVVSTENKCDLGISMAMIKTVEIGDSVFAGGYISDQLGNYVRIPFKFFVDGVSVIDGTSNEFGYWQAGFTPKKPGSSALKITIPSCNLTRTGDITVVEKSTSSPPSAAGAAKSLDVAVYPESLDIGLGTHAILALETTANKDTTIRLTGLPKGWAQPSELTAKTGKNYIYINPDSGAQGNYELNVSAYSGGNLVFSKKISVYVSRQTPAGEKVSESNLLGNAIAVILIGFVVAYAAPRAYGRGPVLNEKQAYLADVKRKIEENMPFK